MNELQQENQEILEISDHKFRRRGLKYRTKGSNSQRPVRWVHAMTAERQQRPMLRYLQTLSVKRRKYLASERPAIRKLLQSIRMEQELQMRVERANQMQIPAGQELEIIYIGGPYWVERRSPSPRAEDSCQQVD